jgi:hypothetical protein
MPFQHRSRTGGPHKCALRVSLSRASGPDWNSELLTLGGPRCAPLPFQASPAPAVPLSLKNNATGGTEHVTPTGWRESLRVDTL